MRKVGIVLAGGQSRRFGSPKAFAKWNERYFYEWSYEALNSECDEVVIITRKELLPLFPEEVLKTTDDTNFAGCGPLAGIYTGMDKVEGEKYIVLPCDMPFVTADVIKNLVDYPSKVDIKAIKYDDRYHPLVSEWSCNVKEAIYQSLIDERLSVMQLMSAVRTEWIPANQVTNNPANVFQNINKPL